MVEVAALTGVSLGAVNKWVRAMGIARERQSARMMKLNTEHHQQLRLLKSKENQTGSEYFDEINTPDKAYWLGFLYADGHVDKEGGKVSCSLKREDKPHLELLASIFGEVIKDTAYYDDRVKKVVLQSLLIIGCKYLNNRLRSLGFYNDKTFTADGKVLDFISDNLIRHFLRGYFDGDGCVSLTGGKLSEVYFSGTRNMVERLEGVILGLVDGLNSPVYKEDSGCWRIRWRSKEDMGLIGEFLYDGVGPALARKQNRFQ